jgi:UrcA family protein
MSIIQSINRSTFWSVALSSLACLACTTEAPAAGPGQVSTTVRFHDLDLSTIDGATALYNRIRRAANLVCSDTGTAGLASYMEWRSCYQTAIADAVTKVNSPLLTAVSQGKSRDALTAMLRK